MEGEQIGTTPIGYKKEAASRGTGSVESRMSRIWLVCEWCDGVYDQLNWHWSQSRCGPDTPERVEEARLKAIDAAHQLTRTAAVVTEEDLAAIRGEPDPLTSLCKKLGVRVVAARRHGTQKRKKPTASTSAQAVKGDKMATSAWAAKIPKSPGGQRPTPARAAKGFPVQQSTSPASDKGPTTTELPVLPVGNTEAHPTSTERLAPDSPATASPKCIQLDTSMTGLGDLAVEAVFPAAGFIRMPDWWVSHNEGIMRRLRDGEILRGEIVWPGLLAGSTAEGVAVEPGWGHPRADEDYMDLYGDLAVGVDGPGQLPPGGVNLMYRGEDCPPAYTRLEVVDRDRLVADINSSRSNREVPGHTCVEQEDGRQWLLSRRLLDAMRDTSRPTVQGPAASMPDSLPEFVTALVSARPHPVMTAYSQRTRGDWPTLQQITYLLTLPILFVCVGPKHHPDTGRLFRVSTSPQEMSLIVDLVLWMKQGYICFKYVLKALLASFRHQGDDDGRSRVGSYHLKTVFLWYMEEHPPQPEGSPYNLTVNLCLKLQQFLGNRCIPNYFIPECNLLEQVGETERQEAISAVDRVLHDPLAAIIGSPCNSVEIFGSRHSSDNLLRCFRAVLSEQPACGAAREALQRLLWDLDKHRVRRYRKQRKEDKRSGLSGRPGLVRLTDCL